MHRRLARKYWLTDGLSLSVRLTPTVKRSAKKFGMYLLPRRTRPTFRSAAARRPLHGPRDWNHLTNGSGYRVLGTTSRRESRCRRMTSAMISGAEDRAVARGGAPLD